MPPRAQYYVVRPGPVTTLPSGGRSQAPARLVPLVAVDQLPEWINIVGVPRELKPEDAATMLAIASYETNCDTSIKIEDHDGHDSLFEVRIVSRKNKATPGQPTSPKIKVEKDEKVEKKVHLVSPTSSPKDKSKTADKTTTTVAKDTKEAPAFVTAPSTPDGAAVVAPTTTTSPTMLAFGQELLAAQEYLTKDKNANGGAPFDNVYDLLVALNQKPLCQHFLNTGAEATKTVSDAVKSKPVINGDTKTDTNILVNDLINFGLTDSQPAFVQLDGQADEEKSAKKEKKKEAEKLVEKESKQTDAKVSIAATSSSGDKKDKKEATSPKPGSPKPGSPPKKTVVAKITWSPPKPRNSNPVKPCRHWCRTGHCDYGTKCYYAHVMPQTPEGLKAVDLGHIPAWWTKRANKEVDKNGNSKDDKNSKVNKAKVAGDGVHGGPRRAEVAAATARKVTSPVPPGAPSRNTNTNPRPARSNSSTSTTDSGPYLNQFSHFKTEMATQKAKEQGTYYAAAKAAAAAPSFPPSTTSQTIRHTRAHSSMTSAVTSAHNTARNPYIGLAMQTSRPSRISWMAGMTATGTTTSATTRSRAQSVASSGATKDSDSSDNSVGDNKSSSGSGSGTSLPHMVAQKELEQEQLKTSVSSSSAPPVREVDDLVDLVDL